MGSSKRRLLACGGQADPGTWSALGVRAREWFGRKLIVGAIMLLATSALAQPGRTYRIAMLWHGIDEPAVKSDVDAFRDGLKALGYAEGADFILDLHGNRAGLESLDAKAQELLRQRPHVVVAWPVFSARALHKHTRAVPIVMAGGAGAVEMGLAASLARPGGNVTGIVTRGELLVTKRFELLRAIAPSISRVALIYSGQQLVHDVYMRNARASAKSLGLTLIEQKVTSPDAVPLLADALRAARCEAIVVAWDPVMISASQQLIELAAAMGVPAVYPASHYARRGGLASYAAHGTDSFRRAAAYVDKILKGANPAELPIEQPTKFEVIVNLNTARTLGLKIPTAVLLRADEAIE